MFVKALWAEQNQDVIMALNQEIEHAIQLIRENPEKALALTQAYFKFPEKILRSALSRTHFALRDSFDLKQEITRYYWILQKPLDETFNSFFYLYQK
jgi:ABC-type nitrate/sulfonate/bicarbonate transport system substrate-binding protein